MTSLRKMLREYGISSLAVKEFAAASPVIAWLYQEGCLWQGRRARARGNLYETARIITTAMRRVEHLGCSKKLSATYAELCRLATADHNAVLDSFRASAQAALERDRFLQHGIEHAVAMKYPRQFDRPQRQGNLVVLKAYNPRSGEKGVLYLQYTESIRPFVAMFDTVRLGREYRLVMEPSSWGYQDVSFLLLCNSGMDAIIEAQDRPDFDIIRSLGGGLVPIRLGAGDWIDGSVFKPARGAGKDFDFVMVANWVPIKRHIVLFGALRSAGLAGARVALVGYPWEGYTRKRVEMLARRAGLTSVSIFESVPRQEVAQIVARSRVGVMLTRREGANRGIYECLFCDVPVVVFSGNRGVNKDHINADTGYLVSEDELPQALVRALRPDCAKSPREWAMAHTGHLNAWRILNARLRERAESLGELYETDIAKIVSTPGAAYVDEDDRKALLPEYRRLAGFLRTGLSTSMATGC